MTKKNSKSGKHANKAQSGNQQKVTALKSRKEKRKQDRIAKKQGKLQFYARKYPAVKSEDTVSSSDEQNKKTIPINNEEDCSAKLQKEKKKEAENKLKNARRKKDLHRANQLEDKNIKKLEKQLKLNKRKGKDKENKLPRSFAAEGLDYLLDVCDSSKIDQLVFSEDDNSDDSENQEDEITSKNNHNGDLSVDQENDNIPQHNEDQHMEDEFIDEEDEDDDEDDDTDADMIPSESESDENTQSDSNPHPIATDSEKCGEEKYWEDIYGRTRDSQGNVVKLQESSTQPVAVSADGDSNPHRYVPPALRSSATTNDERLLKLRRQIKGLLNRLAESNMHLVSRQLEDLYFSNSRNDMNECLCKLITSAIITSSGSTTTPERLVMEHAVLIAILHANVGNEVGAAMLQGVVTQFNDKLQNNKETYGEEKHLENYTMFLCQLYAFRVTTSLVIFDVLNILANTFDAKSVDIIVLILRSVGFILRKDDPNKLKNLILLIQSSASAKQSSEQDTRVKFMLEILLAIKNNNVKKIPNYDSSDQTHWQKIIKGFLRPGITQITPFQIGYEEILSVKSEGRWWIVGSAWTGSESRKNNEVSLDNNSVDSRSPAYSNDLLILARKMRMNTDTRKNIFCSLMSAEDFLDATERLIKLTVNTQQKEREVIFVILTCCLKEKSKFNPYYAQLAIKLSNIDRKYRMASQFAIWDRIKEAQSLEKHELNNLSLFTSRLIIEKALSLACLKIIEFSEINKVLVKFLKTCLLQIIESKEEVRKEVFLAVAGYPKLSQLREGLRLFMRHFILKENSKKSNDEASSSMDSLKIKVIQAEQSLLAGDKKMVL